MRKILIIISNKKNEVLISYMIFLLIFFIYPFNVENKVNTVKVAGTFRLDHILHVLIFLPSTFVLQNKFNLKSSYVLMLGIIMSFFFEFLQWFIPYRAFTIKDLQANIIGSLLGHLSFLLIKNYLKA
jgi:VanZ family protein